MESRFALHNEGFFQQHRPEADASDRHVLSPAPPIGAAVAAGLAVAALGRRVAPPGKVDVSPRLGLPPLASRDVVLYSGLKERQAKSALRSRAAAIRASAKMGILCAGSPVRCNAEQPTLETSFARV
jgi:hypothetical protein